MKTISQVWWALIEEITPCAEEMAGEKEMACCVRGYHVYKDIWAGAIGEVLVCRRWCVIVGKIFPVKLYSRKIFLYLFCVRKYFYNEKKVNYGTAVTAKGCHNMTKFYIICHVIFCRDMTICHDMRFISKIFVSLHEKSHN